VTLFPEAMKGAAEAAAALVPRSGRRHDESQQRGLHRWKVTPPPESRRS